MKDPRGEDFHAALDILAVSRGDEHAWNVLYARAWPFVFSITFRILRDPGSAEDAAQETFIRVARHYPFPRRLDDKVFYAYVAQVARHVAFDSRRRQARIAEEALDEAAETPDSRPQPGADAEAASTLEWLAGRLSESEAALLRQLLREAPSELSDMAQELGVSYSTAAVRLHRLRKRIRQLLRLDVKNG